MDKHKASQEIAALLQQADGLINKAVAISEESGVEFTLPWGGEGTSQRGMGPTYLPLGHSDINETSWGDWRQGWNPSAHSC